MLRISVLSIWFVSASVSIAAPRMEAPEVVNLGEVMPKSMLTGVVEIRNSGSDELVIPKIVTSCSCTLLDVKDLRLKHGEVQKVAYSIRVPNSIGDYESSIAFETNEEKNPKLVKLQFEIQPIVQLLPERVGLWDVAKGDLPWKKEVRLRCTKEGQTLKDVQVRTKSDWVECTVKSVDKSRTFCTLAVTVKKAAPAGMWEVPVEVSCDIEGASRSYVKELMIGGSVKGGYSAEPEVLFIDSGEELNSSVHLVGAGLPPVSCQVVGGGLIGLTVSQNTDGSWQVGKFAAAEGAQGILVFSDQTTQEPLVAVPIYLAPPRKPLKSAAVSN